tara:strand:+ start:240 stop:563 length:324 start_codon:yes stop_codon:yes gene_type:complete
MKLTKSRLRQIIKEELERSQLDEEDPVGTSADVAKATMTGAAGIRQKTYTREEAPVVQSLIQLITDFAGIGDLGPKSAIMVKLQPAIDAMQAAVGSQEAAPEEPPVP